MTVTSQNGWSANDRSLVASYTVPGTTRKLVLRKGDVSVVLLDFAAWFHKNIERIDVGQQDDWGYAERPIRGSSTTLSNHASGTAMDLNALAHRLGAYNTYPAVKIALIERKLKEYAGVIRWGHDYSGRKDEMHFEINAGYAAVKAQADRIRYRNAHPNPTAVRTPVVVRRPAFPPFPGNMNAKTIRDNAHFKQWQTQMKARGWNITPDGDGGPQSANVLVQFRHEKGIQPVSSWIVDRAAWQAAWTAKR